MTIAAAWVRTLETGVEELILCSDSRLSGGNRFDQGQKTFRFARTDAAICFAGGTNWAYPMIVAAVKAADLHTPSRTRALSLVKFKGHLLNILNQMQQEVHSFAPLQNIPDVTFLFGGYDWGEKGFRIWRISFDANDSRFRSDERTGSNALGGLGKIELAGDPEWVASLREKIKSMAQERYGLNMRTPDSARFNMEPLEGIRDLLRSANAHDSIGGAPQAIKVYQYMNSADVGIFWPNHREGRLYLSGRPLLDYERAVINSVLCPDALVSTWSSGGAQQASAQVAKAAKSSSIRRGEQDQDASDVPEQ